MKLLQTPMGIALLIIAVILLYLKFGGGQATDIPNSFSRVKDDSTK